MTHAARSPRGDNPLFKRPERRLVDMRAYAVRSDDSIIDVRVLDLSYDGCAIESIVTLGVGEELKLSVLGRGAVEATVRWCRGRKVGLMFGFEPKARAEQPRATERLPVSAEVALRRSGSISYRARIFDASTHGCSCEFIERPRIDERVWVKFDDLEALEAEVTWVEDTRLGLRYARPMHPAVFDMLMHRLGV